MNTQLFKNLKFLLVASLALCCATVTDLARAEADWIAVTVDNDALVGNDSGYTNGLYVTWIDTPDNEKAEPGFLMKAMMWSLPDSDASTREFAVRTIGQAMITPDDIEEDPPTPPPDDLPYGGLLFYTDSFARVRDNYADRAGVTIGIVGEYSFAEESQEFVHKLIDSDEPCCWDTQLDDEVVFLIHRDRMWRTWASDSDSADFLLGAGVELGTIQSSVGATAVVRYGSQLKQNYATTLLANSRTANPLATDSGWYVYAGMRLGYLANQIFLDGSKSYDDDLEELDYTNETLGYSVGLAYAWQDVSLTFALNELNALEDDDVSEEWTEYGTFTLAWRVD
jgi:lipid A 3-O-deacylase